MTPALSNPLAPALPPFRQATSHGQVQDVTHFHPAFSLHASPALGVGGVWRSPAGRLLELEITTQAPGDWIALHIALEGTGDLADAWIGFACRSAAPDTDSGDPDGLMIRPCLRSGTDDGFIDCFFDKHILATPEPQNHLDILHLDTRRNIPETAPWRELLLFLPRRGFRWDLHDLRPFQLCG